MSKTTYTVIAHAGEVGLLMNDEATGKTHTMWIPPEAAENFASEISRVAAIAREQTGQQAAKKN